MYLTLTIVGKASYNLSTPIISSSIYFYLIEKYQVNMAVTQRALLVQEIGKPLVLVQHHPIPEPGHDQVQIKVSVAGKSNDQLTYRSRVRFERSNH